MEYLIKTHKGIDFDVSEGAIEAEKFLATMNTRTMIAVSIGNIVMNKNNIKLIVPKEQPSEELATHTLAAMSGETYRVTLEDYKAKEISGMLNNPQLDFVLIGGIIIHKQNFDFLQ